MTIAVSQHLKNTWKNTHNLPRIILAALLFLGLVAISSEAFADKRTPIPRDQASDNIALCEATGGFTVRTPSVVACCNENANGTTTCVGCAPDGSSCANYEVRTGSSSDTRRSLMQMAPASGGVLAPQSTSPKTKVLKNKLQNGPVKAAR